MNYIARFFIIALMFCLPKINMGFDAQMICCVILFSSACLLVGLEPKK